MSVLPCRIPVARKMREPTSATLQFGDEVTSIVRARIGYAFRVFAAIYNYRVIEGPAGSGAVCFEYREQQRRQTDARYFQIPARYRVRSKDAPADALVAHRHAGEDLYLMHGIDAATGNPDWLGEIFEWISSSLERGISARDAVGRIPYRETIFAKQSISPFKPYATLLMAWMEDTVRKGTQSSGFAKAPSPVSGAEHLVICSHDIDFYSVNKTSTIARLVKNLGIALFTARSRSFFSSSANLLAGAIVGKEIGDYLPAMLVRIEQRGFKSTLFVVARRGHRRDPNYELRHLVPRLREASARGFSVDLHGSYTSVIEDDTLKTEAMTIERLLKNKLLGNRQHWLRFDEHEKLFRAVEAAELVFDSTLGFSDMVGFRNGASFAFPPYDFSNERPYRFLEIPLVLMDVNIDAATRTLGQNPQVLADRVLQESRKWAWGGFPCCGTIRLNPYTSRKRSTECSGSALRNRGKRGTNGSARQTFWSCA